jgi:hypothetical protein
MFESYRGYFLAAGVAGFAAVAFTGSAELRCQRDDYTHNSYYIHDNAGHSKPTRFDRAWLPCLVERVATNPDASATTEHDQRDLIAQETTSLWAFWMMIFSGATAIVTAFGTVLIWRQVSLTRQAVEDTGLATKAMQVANEKAGEANSLARQQLRAQYLPLLVIEPFGPLADLNRAIPGVLQDLRLYIGLKITNHGLGTARITLAYPVADPPVIKWAIIGKDIILKPGETTCLAQGKKKRAMEVWENRNGIYPGFPTLSPAHIDFGTLKDVNPFDFTEQLTFRVAVNYLDLLGTQRTFVRGFSTVGLLGREMHQFGDHNYNYERESDPDPSHGNRRP